MHSTYGSERRINIYGHKNDIYPIFIFLNGNAFIIVVA